MTAAPPATTTEPGTGISSSSSASKNLLSVSDLTVLFDTPVGPRAAVDGVSFDVRDREILGLVGESGSGKSVTLSSIMGLTRSDSARIEGSARLGDTELISADESTLRRIRGKDVGMVFQNPMTALNPVRTVGAQLADAIRLHDRTVSRAEIRERSRDALADVGVPAPQMRLGQYAHELSGGLQQRVAIAMALINAPGLVIADEPTTALDVTVQAQVLDLLLAARERGASVVVVTHDLGVLAEVADRVAVMYAGRIVEIGPVADVIDHVAHPYTAGLRASLPRLGTRMERLTGIGGAPPLLVDRPTGCAFHPRCAHTETVCTTDRPELRPVGDAHASACHRWEVLHG
ncbi:ABC transporter ATP-binding protein [Pseudonocardia sp. NPDC049635]|uniref:ABC transporter ATP-binding protein n=1 Tax=Pseudonocardia sp. NPDC049635 TaxID=3155506 RepID=UPI00340AF5D1